MVRSRVALAVAGMLIIGGIAAAVGAASANRSGGVTAGAPSAAQTTSPASDSAATETASATSATAGAQASPTAAATRTPRPTPTRPPVGVVVDLHGIIDSMPIAAGTFVLREGGGVTDTVQMSAQTTCQGIVTNCANLQKGMAAEVKGSFPSANAAFQAIEVNAQPADN